MLNRRWLVLAGLALCLSFPAAATQYKYIWAKVGYARILVAKNEAPSAVVDAFTVTEDTPEVLDVLANDSDEVMSTLSVAIQQTTAHGTLTETAPGKFNYHPASNFHGTDSFTYTLTDEKGKVSAQATVNITVSPVNDQPTISDIPDKTVQEDGVINDIYFTVGDLETSPGVLTLTWESDNLSLVPLSAIDEIGSGANRHLIVTPTGNMSGTAKITVEVSDGELFQNEVFYVTVTAVNDPPVTVADSPLSAQEDIEVTSGNLLANDTDVDGDVLSIRANSLSVRDAGNNPVSATVSIVSGNQIRFGAPDNQSGIFFIDYRVIDGHGGDTGAVLQVNVTAVNDAPVTVADSPLATEEDVEVTSGNLLANDTDVEGDLLSIKANSLSVRDAGNNPVSATVSIVSGNQIRFRAPDNQSGTFFIDYRVIDGHGGDTGAVLQVNVTAVNDAPVTAADSPLATEEDVEVTSDNLLANDTDVDGDVLSIKVNSLSVRDAGNNPVSATVSIVSGNQIRFRAPDNQSGTFFIDYRVIDGNGGDTGAVLQVNVTAVNDAPVTAADSPLATEEDVEVTSDNLLANDTDVDGDVLSIKVNSLVVKDDIGNTIDSVGGIVGTNRIHFAPPANQSGTYTVEYTVLDGHGGEAAAVLTVVVSAQNDPVVGVPVITGGSSVGDTLTVDASHLSDIDGLGTFSYQWLRNGIAVSGQTSSTYIVVSDDQLKAVSVTVSYTDGGGTAEEATSAPVTIAALPAPTVTITNMLDGSTLPVNGLLVQASTSDNSLTKDVQFSTDSGVTWYSDVDAAPPWQYDFGLRDSGSYVVWVRAISTADMVSANQTVSVTLKLETPNLVIENQGSETTYDVRWGAVTGATYYELQEKVNGGSWAGGNYAETRKSYISQLIGTYEYRVRACDSGGCGDFSPVQSKVVEPAIGQCPVL